MISLLVCSRISGNENFKLFSLLDSLKKMSANYNNFEVLVKFDSDDKKVKRVISRLGTYKFRIKYIIEPRGRGYLDLHVFYNRLFSLVDERSIVIGAVGDDFEITQERWDELILSKTVKFDDRVFIIHGRPHPPYFRKNYEKQKFFLEFSYDTMEDLEIIDEAPFWSRKLLNICGGLGHLSFTDVWTLALEYYLYHGYGMNRTIFLDRPLVHRNSDTLIDKRRWWTDRTPNFAFAKSDFYRTLVDHQALNIYAYAKLYEQSKLPPPFVERKFELEIPKLKPDDRTISLMLMLKVRDSLPSFMRTMAIKLYWAINTWLRSHIGKEK